MKSTQRGLVGWATTGLLLAGFVCVAVAQGYDDRQTGNWTNWATWNGSDLGYPDGAGDTVLIDSAVVQVSTLIDSNIDPVTIALGGTLQILQNSSDQNVDLTLAGGLLSLPGNTAVGDSVNGDITVTTNSGVFAQGHGNPMARQADYLNGDIKDGATTGQLHLTGANYALISLSGNNSGFSGGFLVDCPGSPSLLLRSAGSLGTGATTINAGGLRVDVTQTNGIVPSSLRVESGKGLTLYNHFDTESITLSGWNIAFAHGAFVQFGPDRTGKIDNTCTLTLEGALRIGSSQDGRWNGAGEIATPLATSSNILVAFPNVSDSGLGGENGTIVRLSADNRGITGDIRVDVAATPANPMYNVLEGAAANALGTNNSIIIDDQGTLRPTVSGALNGSQQLYLLASAITNRLGVLDLNEDNTVSVVRTGGVWNAEIGAVEGGFPVPKGLYDGAGPLNDPADLGGFVDFSDGAGGYNTLTVLNSGLPLRGIVLRIR
jgi:hypothetical protein